MGDVPRATVKAFYEAYATFDPVKCEPYIHDDIQWMVAGPVDLLKFCGAKRGKAEVLDFIGRVLHEVFEHPHVTPQLLLVDGDRASALARMSGTQRRTGRSVAYSVAQFFRFQDGRLIELYVLIDSFDAAQQVLGHTIGLPGADDTVAPRDDLVAV